MRPERSNRSRRAANVVVAAALLASLALALVIGCSESAESSANVRPAVVVQTVVATSTELPQTFSAVGTLESPEMATVAWEIAGTLVAADIPEGQRVQAGHVLARIDDAQARAALSVAEARRKSARDRLARLGNLRAESVSSAQAFDDAQAEFDAAQGEFEEARTRLDKTTVRAPYAGVLGLSQVHVGQYVAAGTPIVEITQVHPLELHFSLPQSFVSQLAVGQTVLGVVGRCGERFEGRVEAIDPRVDPGTRTVRLQAVVPNERGELYAGMAVRVRLLVGHLADSIVLPQEAVVRQGTRHFVYTLDEQQHAQQNEVRLGQYFVDGVQIAEGIAPGDTVVVAGQQKLRPGTPTQPQAHEPTRNPNVDLGRFGPLGCDST